MKLYPIEKRYREGTRAQRKAHVNDNTGERRSANPGKHTITPISQAVMEYYENLLKEHNQMGARHSAIEYRIF